MSIAELNATMAEETPQEQKLGKREGQKRNAQKVRLPQPGTPSNISNQIKDGVADDYHDSPTPPAQSSASSKRYSAPLIQKLIHGDCLDKLKLLADNTVDLICTDPPYGLEFMGKDWDKALPSIAIWRECLRVLKPGAFAFIMSSPRQDLLSRMIIQMEDAGFTVNFTPMYWTYATGFPKIHRIGKPHNGSYSGFQPKPAVEVILVAMKPLQEKTYKKQAAKNGKGCTWMDDCRIPYTDETIPSRDLSQQKSSASGQVPASKGNSWQGNNEGRFPANLLISDDVLNDGKNHKGNCVNGWSKLAPCKSSFGLQPMGSKSPAPSDDGCYSRFFSLDAWAERNLPFLIVPKASKSEKNAGLENMPYKVVSNGRKKSIDNAYQRGETLKKNNHPTVKPTKLLTYLITMASRPGDIVIDPFMGSGSSLIAAECLNRSYIGIEREEEYFKIATKRVNNAKSLTHTKGVRK